MGQIDRRGGQRHVENRGQVEVVKSCMANRDGVSGHDRARASGSGGGPRQSFVVENGGRLGVVGCCGASIDGVSGHARAQANGQRQGFGVENVGRVAVANLDLAGQEEMASVAMSELGHLGQEAHAKALALKRGVEWKSLDPAVRAEMASAAMSELNLRGHLKKQIEATEACAWKIA